eukprot:1134319-Pelagomonas_calceolata.AAC.2
MNEITHTCQHESWHASHVTRVRVRAHTHTRTHAHTHTHTHTHTQTHAHTHVLVQLGTLVVAETHHGGKLNPSSLSTITAALQLGQPVTALVMGNKIQDAADNLARTGIAKVCACTAITCCLKSVRRTYVMTSISNLKASTHESSDLVLSNVRELSLLSFGQLTSQLTGVLKRSRGFIRTFKLCDE